MFIDPHVHCRDGKQAYKETIKHALSVAERAGFTAIFDMPNTDPPITSREHVVERLKIAEKSDSPVFYGIHMAMTADVNQIKEAVDTYKEFFPHIVGFKLYAGHSVGNIGVIGISDQQRIYETLKDCGYEGVLAVHCEKESLLRMDLWDPKNPVSHAHARPPEAEIESLKDQIMLVQESGFGGILHVTHISVPEAVEIVNNAKRKIHITCAATPHHLILDSSVMQTSNGLLYKINPPIRAQMANKLLSYLKQGKIDWIETDHSPQTLDEKLNPPYMSGIPSLHYYPRFINWLRAKGFSESQIRDLTFNNITKAYGINLKPRQAIPSLELGSEYPFDPFKGIL